MKFNPDHLEAVVAEAAADIVAEQLPRLKGEAKARACNSIAYAVRLAVLAYLERHPNNAGAMKLSEN
jgi:hypothetical protein